MSEARRTDVSVFFAGKDITKSLRPYLISVSYTDNEEDNADDLQIKIEDSDGVWLEKWLNQAIQSAASASYDDLKKESTGEMYKVKSWVGANVRSRPGKNYYIYGTLAYGTVITSVSTEKGWVKFDYSGKDGYVDASCLSLVTDGGVSSAFAKGDEVVVNGQPQFTAFGIGIPFQKVTNYKGKITNISTTSWANYPIKVGTLGWFTTAQVQKKEDFANSDRIVDKVTKGLLIQAAIVRQNWEGEADRHLDCGQFELDSVDCSGPPNSITIKGTSLPYHRTIRQTKKSRSWEAYYLKGIANEMADKSGMTCMYLTSRNPYYDRAEQVEMSDVVFLQLLCQRIGASLKITNNIIVIFDQEEYEEKDAVKVIKRGSSGGYSKYKLASGEADAKYAKCHVCYTDPSSGDVIEATAYAEGYDENDEDNQTLEIKEKVSSIADAQELAAKMLRLKNKYEYTATFTFPGDPKLLAGSAVELQGWGAWDGKYIIKSAKHTVSKSGYTTQISLRHAVEGC